MPVPRYGRTKCHRIKPTKSPRTREKNSERDRCQRCADFGGRVHRRVRKAHDLVCAVGLVRNSSAAIIGSSGTQASAREDWGAGSGTMGPGRRRSLACRALGPREPRVLRGARGAGARGAGAPGRARLPASKLRTHPGRSSGSGGRARSVLVLRWNRSAGLGACTAQARAVGHASCLPRIRSCSAAACAPPHLSGRAQAFPTEHLNCNRVAACEVGQSFLAAMVDLHSLSSECLGLSVRSGCCT